jgi:hypothetical protein
LEFYFIVGLVWVFTWIKPKKVYDHELIVQPNFGSTDYLYSKVELLASKINERDTVFLKSIGIK